MSTTSRPLARFPVLATARRQLGADPLEPDAPHVRHRRDAERLLERRVQRPHRHAADAGQVGGPQRLVGVRLDVRDDGGEPAVPDRFGWCPTAAATPGRRAPRSPMPATENRDPDVRITDLAMRWGFFHPSRFAQQYRERYGELPSETVRRT